MSVVTDVRAVLATGTDHDQRRAGADGSRRDTQDAIAVNGDAERCSR